MKPALWNAHSLELMLRSFNFLPYVFRTSDHLAWARHNALSNICLKKRIQRGVIRRFFMNTYWEGPVSQFEGATHPWPYETLSILLFNRYAPSSQICEMFGFGSQRFPISTLPFLTRTSNICAIIHKLYLRIWVKQWRNLHFWKIDIKKFWRTVKSDDLHFWKDIRPLLLQKACCNPSEDYNMFEFCHRNDGKSGNLKIISREIAFRS